MATATCSLASHVHFCEMSHSLAPVAAASGDAPLVLSKAHPSHPLVQEGQQVTAECLIGGRPTTFILTSFVDRIFLAVTQMNKVGTLTLAATHRAPTADSEAPTFSIVTLLGVRNAPVPQLLARRLIESLSNSKQQHMANKSLLLSLGLKKAGPRKQADADEGLMTVSEEEMATIKEIVDQVEKMKQW